MTPLALFDGVQGTIIKWLIIGLLIAAGVATGFVIGKRYEGGIFADYKAEQAIKTIAVIQGRERVVHDVQIKYVDRIQTVTVKGDDIIKEVPVYVTKADDAGCTINVGFVREFNAAWRNEPPGLAGETDRGPSGVPLSDVATAEATNAKACHIYRTQRDGLIEFYKRLQLVK